MGGNVCIREKINGEREKERVCVWDGDGDGDENNHGFCVKKAYDLVELYVKVVGTK